MITKELIEEHFRLCEVNKKLWPEGPWMNEPHRMEWKNGDLDCLAIRNKTMGFWCGYVGLKSGHPLYGKHYSDILEIDAHGGLTYSDFCQGEICHFNDNQEEHKLYWLGFDCAHAWDQYPLSQEILGFKDELSMYRDLTYVKTEVENLALQLSIL